MRFSIRLKLILPLVLGLGVIAVATAVLMRFVHEQVVDRAALHEVEQAAALLESQEAIEQDRLESLAEAIAGDATVGRLLRDHDRDGLLAETATLYRRLRDDHGITHLYFHDVDPARGVLLRVHRPELAGDVVRRPSFLRAVETGRPAGGREFGRTAYAVRVVHPWREDGKLVGYVELGTDIHTFLERLKRVSGDEYGMLLDKRTLEPAAWASVTGHPERWDDRPELVAVTSTTGSDEIFGRLGRVAELPEHAALVEQLRMGERRVARGLFPLRGEDGRVVGVVVVHHDITALLTGVADLRLRVVVLVVLLAAALAALVVFLLEALVFERVERMSRTLQELPDRLARGELEHVEAPPPADDELGRVEGFLDRAIEAVGSFVADARRKPTVPPGQLGRRPYDQGP